MPTSKSSKSRPAAPAGDKQPDERLDAEIADDLAERQDLDLAGRSSVAKRQREHASASPKLSGGDVDANWENATGDGEEMVGGETPTPDQDRVDEIGEGVGLTYQDDEPLNYNKILARDQHRWELNPASALEAGEDEMVIEVGENEEEDLDELGLLDGEGDALEVLDVDDLAEDEDEAEEIDEAGLENLDELEDDDTLGPEDDDEDEDDEDEEDEDADEDDEADEDDF
jgi:hypothetical protein